MTGPRARKAIAGFAVAVALAMTVWAGAATASAGEATIVEETELSARVLELTVDTPAFSAPTKLHVFLPADYDAEPTRLWPVTYFTAGTMNRFSAFRDALDGESLTAGYPSIVVSPDANSGYWSDWYNAGAFGPPKYETFVIDQLIPLIDQRFRTIADRSRRAIFGISMGGYGAMMLAARHPDMFGAAATLSGAVDSNLPINAAVLSLSSTFDDAPQDAIYGPRLTQEVRWRGHNPTDLAGNLRGLALQVRTANGTLNPTIGEGGDPNDALSCAVEAGVYSASVNLHDRLSELGVPHDWVDYGDGCHSRQNFIREVVDTLAGFEQFFSTAPTRPRMIDHRSIEPEFDLWGWRFKADPDRALEFMRVRWDGRTKLTLEGSGQTTVTSPSGFRGLRRVSVGGSVKRPTKDGRVRFKVVLGKANRTQQYTGSTTPIRRRTLEIEPYAVIRIARAAWSNGRLQVCARAIGGTVPRARIYSPKTGQAGTMKLTITSSCRTVAMPVRPRRVLLFGADRFLHPVRSSAPVS
jgi:S-formylglutathione hydrolase FrmB